MNQINETWASWVDTHYEALLARAVVLFRGKTDVATDFLHDLLLELRKKWDAIQNPLAWISSSMRYRMVDYLQKEKTMPLQQNEESRHNDLPLQMDIEAAISRLPHRLRTVLTLFLEGNSIPEIAAHVHLSPDAVYQRLCRARKHLKGLLGGEAHGTGLQRRPGEAFTFTM